MGKNVEWRGGKKNEVKLIRKCNPHLQGRGPFILG